MTTKTQLDQIIKREAEMFCTERKMWESAHTSTFISGANLLIEPLAIALEALDLIDKELTCPAAEYVPAMQECFKIKDKALERIEKLLGGINNELDRS